MAIKAVDTAPVKIVLTKADPSGDTFLLFRRPTWRDDELRGELLKESQLVMTDNGLTKRIMVNPYLLRTEEIWILYFDGNLVLEDLDGKQTSMLRPKENMTKDAFMQVLRDSRLGVEVLWEIHNEMIEKVAPEWRYPF